MKFKIKMNLLLIVLIASCNNSENKIVSNNLTVTETNDKIDTVTKTIENKTSSVIFFTSTNFQEKVLMSKKLVMVDFWAQWAGPSRMVGPIIEDIAREYEGKVVIGKLDVDESPDISQKYNVKNVPTILIFKNGEVVDKLIGAMTKSKYCSKLDAQLKTQ